MINTNDFFNNDNAERNGIKRNIKKLQSTETVKITVKNVSSTKTFEIIFPNFWTVLYKRPMSCKCAMQRFDVEEEMLETVCFEVILENESFM